MRHHWCRPSSSCTPRSVSAREPCHSGSTGAAIARARECPRARTQFSPCWRNRTYLGEVCFRDAYHPAPHPPLLDRELFSTAQTVLQERGEDWSLRASNPSEYLLAGLVVCHRCQHRYVGGAAKGRSARYRYYTCWTRHHYGPEHCNADRLPAPDLEAAVLASLRRTYERRDLLARAVAAWCADVEASRPRYEEQLAQVSQEIAKTEDAIERYLLAFEARTLAETQCGLRVRALTEKVAELRQRRAELMSAIDDDPPRPEVDVDLEAIKSEIADVLDGDSDRSARKAVLQTLIAEVRVESRDAITPTFRGPLQAPGSHCVRIGWGGRIRTYDWLIQSQLPYHLATPQGCVESTRPPSDPRFWRRYHAPILERDGSAGVAAISSSPLPLLRVRRKHGRLRHKRARPARQSRARPCDVRVMQ